MATLLLLTDSLRDVLLRRAFFIPMHVVLHLWPFPSAVNQTTISHAFVIGLLSCNIFGLPWWSLENYHWYRTRKPACLESFTIMSVSDQCSADCTAFLFKVLLQTYEGLHGLDFSYLRGCPPIHQHGSCNLLLLTATRCEYQTFSLEGLKLRY